MSFTTAPWTADGDHLLPVAVSSLASEEQLEIWIEKDPSVLGYELLIIGRQIRTVAGRLDLLALDEDAELVILDYPQIDAFGSSPACTPAWATKNIRN